MFKIALFNPKKDLFSETFIKAHKLNLKDKVFYYYGDFPNIVLEGDEKRSNHILYWLKVIYNKLRGNTSEKIKIDSTVRSLIRNEINVILVEYGPHAHKLIPVFKRIDIPVVVHFHGYDASRKNVLERFNNYKKVFKIASKIVVVSKVMQANFIKMGCPKAKLVYNVYGPRVEFEDVQSNYAKKQFVSIGRFTDKKAPYYTLLAFQKVLKKHPDARLKMAGDGPLLNMCINLATYLSIDKNVDFIGVIDANELKRLLSVSLSYIQHSITALDGDMEGTPLSILEASVSGLPVISTRHAGIPDVIIDGKTGLLCNEHDVDTMATHMIRLLDNIEEAKSFGRAGKRNILENYSFSRHIKGLQSILHEAAS